MKRYSQHWFILGLFSFFVIFSFETNAQVSVDGIPESFNLTLKKAIQIPTLHLDSVRVHQLLEEDKKFRIDNRYGIVQQLDISLKETGIKTTVPGKGNIWQYKIESKNALSLGISFKTFNLPKGASIFIFNTSKSILRGAFTEQNNNSDRLLPIAEFPGNNLIVEYFEPSSADFSGEVVLGSVSQAYLDFESAASSQLEINCTPGSNWQVEKHSVCLMTFRDSRYSYFCTGSLINNTREDEKPFFLTANHCISNEAEASTMVTYFNYENSICTSNDAKHNQTLSGSTLKSGNSDTDFSLLLLNEYPRAEYQPFFAGWDASGKNPKSGVCIHHPEGLPKCIAINENPIISYASSTNWTDESDKLNSTSSPDSHWLVDFSLGTGYTESGSSGSPLFNENKRIVGQLHGGSRSETLFGKLSLSWNNATSCSSQLACWLDPENTGVKILDGFGRIPPQANFSAQIQEVCVNTPVLFSDKSMYRPSKWLWNVQPSTFHFTHGTDSTSQNPEIIFLEDGVYSVALSASNKYGSNVITLTNYIEAKSKLDVRFLQADADSVVCGCDLDMFPLVLTGAYNYTYSVTEKEKIDSRISSDTLFLSLNKSEIGGKSFDTWVKVTGTHGSCTASDSILLHVIVQPNDNIAHAARLLLGRNSGYSNQCASTETKEPFPLSSSCLVSNNWCPDEINSGYVLDNSIWFTFVAPSNGLLSIATSGFDDQIAIYDAASPSSILSGKKTEYTMLAANDNRSASDNTARIENLTLDPGKKYWLQVDGNNAAFGNLVIDLVGNSIEVYPNPSSGIFNLIISNPVSGLADVIVYDLQGRKLFEKQYAASIASNKFSIDLSGYAKGMYLLNVSINGSSFSKKLIRW